jgi:hypothetical protein
VKPKPADAPTSKPSTTTARTTTDDSLDVGGLLPDALSNPMVLGAGGVLLCLVGFLLMRRRRRPLPNDLDVMAIAEGRDGPDTLMGQLEKTSDPLSQGGRGGSALDGLFDDEPQPDSPRTARQAPTRASAPPTGGGADESLFDTEADPNAATMMGDPKMNQGMSDLPADPDRMPSSSAAGGSSAPDSDVLRVVHELERRMAQLEGKLQEANEARERLERQVAAQSEELRVQRAAIARTQRALRTMSRGDEDKATEPALRDGDTQTRTRVATE